MVNFWTKYGCFSKELVRLLCSNQITGGCGFSFRYVDQFSRCLYVEYKKSGIDVQCQVRLLPRKFAFSSCAALFVCKKEK